MAYKIPEKNRLTADNVKKWTYLGKDILTRVSESFNQEDGFFWLPVVNSKGDKFEKSARFLCRATKLQGWRVVAVNVPSQGRSATWEELHWVKKFFWDDDDMVFMFHPGKSTYVYDNTFWLHLWQPDDMKKMYLPPIFEEDKDKDFFRKSPFFVRLWRTFINRAKKL